MTTLSFVVAVFVVSASALPSPVRAQSRFVIRKGKDTVAVEMFKRDATTLTSDIVQTNGPRWQYTANLRPDSSVLMVDATRQTRAGVSSGVMVRFADTLVTMAVSTPAGSEKMDVSVHGKATPFLAVSFALAEQIVQASRLGVGKSAKWIAFRLGAGDSTTLTVSRFHADSASLTMADIELRVALAKNGEIIGGRHVGQDWIVERRSGK